MNNEETRAARIQVVKGDLTSLRSELLHVEKKIHELRGIIPPLANNPSVDMTELAANITLAFRHLEDSRMRLGKAIQSLEGGVSIFDKPTMPFPLTPSGSPRAHEGEPAPSPF